jgi:hypothetical protein
VKEDEWQYHHVRNWEWECELWVEKKIQKVGGTGKKGNYSYD